MNELAIDDGAGRPVRSRSRIINHAARRAGRQYDGVVAWQWHWHSVCQSVPLVLSPLVGPTHQLQLVHFSLQFLQGRELPCGGSWNLEIQTTCPPPLPSSSSPPHFYLLLPAAIIASRLAWLVYRQGHHSTKLFPLLSTSAVSSGLPIRSLASSSSSPPQPFPRSFSAPALHQGTARASTLHFA